MLSTTKVDPFTTKDLVNLPELDTDNSRSWSGFRFESEPQNQLLSLAQLEQPNLPQLLSDTLKLNVTDVPLSSLESTSESSAPSSDSEDGMLQEKRAVEEDEEDIWKISGLLVEKQENKLISWDHFTQRSHEKPPCQFASEAGSAAFDLLLRKFFTKMHDTHIKYVKPDVLIAALFDLGLGRSSVIFVWNEQSQRFETLIKNFTVSGVSQDTLRILVDQFLDAGAQFRRLRSFGESRQKQSPTRIALQTALSCILHTLEDTVESVRQDMRSLIRLQNAYHRPCLLLGMLDRLVREVRSIQHDSDLVAAILAVSELSALEQPQFEIVMYTMISQMLQPTLRCIETDIGLVSPNGSVHMQDEKVISVMLLSPTVEIYAQARLTVHILQEHEDNFMSLQQRRHENDMLVLGYSSDTITTLQNNADVYEQSGQETTVMLDRSGLPGRTTEQPEYGNLLDPLYEGDPFSFKSGIFGSPPLEPGVAHAICAPHNEPLKHLVTKVLNSEVETPIDTILTCRQAIDLSVSPLLKAQHRLLSYSALRILFQTFSFVSHMELLARFQLLEDGNFASKLSISLFDSEQVSGEGNRITYTKTGLRLQNRETWPPASSELRLALMGILSECMSNVKNAALTNSVSFAIRDLSDEDLECCRDIDSVYALDFLKLNYKPPCSIIETIVTSQSLEKYDQVFNQLLRLLRMKAVTQSMLRTASGRHRGPVLSSSEHKFKIEAQQFVSALGSYYQNAVIRTTWPIFETKLQTLKVRLEQRDYTGTLELAGGLHHLRDMHDGMLDRICRGLLLRQRQSEAKGVIDRLFEVILRFAALTAKTAPVSAPKGNEGINDDKETITTIARLRKDFEMHMKHLVRWLKIGSGRAGDDGNEMFEQLLLELDWNGYWST